jgi:hypothetical protein
MRKIETQQPGIQPLTFTDAQTVHLISVVADENDCGAPFDLFSIQAQTNA